MSFIKVIAGAEIICLMLATTGYFIFYHMPDLPFKVRFTFTTLLTLAALFFNPILLTRFSKAAYIRTPSRRSLIRHRAAPCVRAQRKRHACSLRMNGAEEANRAESFVR